MNDSLSSSDNPTLPLMSLRCVAGWSLFSAITLYFAFPPAGLWPLAWIAPLGWLAIVRVERLPRRAYAAIYLSGALFWLALLYGVGNSHWATRLFGWPTLCGYLAVYTPLFVATCRTAVQRCKIPLTIAAPVCWVGWEFVRAHFATGFAVGLIGHTQAAQLPLIQISNLVGAYGVSFVVVLWAAAIVDAGLIDRWIRPQPAAPTLSFRLTAFTTATILLLATLAYGWRQLATTEAGVNETLTAALVQGSIDTSFDDPTQPQRTFEQYVQLTDEATRDRDDLDLILWPETTMGNNALIEVDGELSVPADATITAERYRELLLRYRDEYLLLVDELANRRWKTPLLLGTSTLRYGQHGTQIFNSALYIPLDQAPQLRYDKTHPVMFGEYVPLGDVFPWIYKMTPMGGGLTPGAGPVAIDVGERVRLIPCICFENTVPHLVRRHAAAAADPTKTEILVTLTNDGWFWGSSVLDLHLLCAQFRSAELRKPMLIAANTGFSASIDRNGRPLAIGPRQKTKVLIVDIPLDTAPPTIYQRYGDLFAGTCGALTLLLLGLGFISRWRRKN
ncbi:apolipoprotein N-acyltransferase [Blastopirellula sp. J2-11]|uniref:apolipoprotein N-acyltransferase n=1 Tax=Blastopirellula sp. J2-11 TaxID=2943192 RepID=UPI0021C62A8B|nr:apolipoprotein N-acyltransferase [Blastopirellula sp. J2-11]UUO06040.1 apolipoprotein N-acyltransferase [Blastopirellula sp. J2-11]